jgi:hypothetical protein
MLLFFKLEIERAIAREIARGIPSGMATIKMQMDKIQIRITFNSVGFDQRSTCSSIKVTMSKLREATVAMAIVATMQYLLIYLHDYSNFSS